MKPISKQASIFCAALLTLASGSFAQTTPTEQPSQATPSNPIGTEPLPPAAPSPTPATASATPGIEIPSTEALPTNEQTLQLSPFIVNANADQGYLVNSTLAGTRVNTNLNDIPSSLSIITTQFLQDTGATNDESLLVYTTNTEVGGLNGNYAGVGNTFLNGVSESANLLNPQNNTRVRGLDSADQTRDYFLTDIPWDSFDVDRIDMQRGPNSILFGIGSPAGIINASVNDASYENIGKVENRTGSFGSQRDSLDINRVILPNELAFRLEALDDDTQYRQNPAYNHDERIFGALRWDPKFLDSNSSNHTTIRANFEIGQVSANNPRVLPPTDQITPFFNTAGGINNSIDKTAWDPGFAMASGEQATIGNSPIPGLAHNPWISQGMGSGLEGGYNPGFFYLGSSASPVLAYQQVPFAPQGTIGGLSYWHNLGIAGYGTYAFNNSSINPSDPATLGGDLGLYKDKSISDPTIFNFFDNLIDGPNKEENQHRHAFNVTLDQSLFDGRLAFDLADDYQDYYAMEESNLSNPFISVDINANLVTNRWPYATSVSTYNGADAPGTNPYAGYAFTGGSGNSGNDSFASVRNNLRLTATEQFQASDVMGDSWLSRLLGKQVFTGLLSNQQYNTETRTWDRYAMDSSYAAMLDPGVSDLYGLTGGNDLIDTVTYLSAGPLFNLSSAHGLNVPGLTTTISPGGTSTFQWFNPTYNSSVSSTAAWNNPTELSSGQLSTQLNNPANYVGWTAATIPILNADKGNIDSLYTSGTKIRTSTTSAGFTWQGSFWDDTVDATIGVRRDEQKQWSGSAPIDPTTGAAVMNYDVDESTAPAIGDSTSWGLVVHEPKIWRDKLPWGTNVSLIFDIGNNERVQERYGFDGSLLPNADGHTQDYGFAINTLHDRLRLKVTWYDTKVKNANLSSTTTETSTLGVNTYAIYQLEAATTVGAMIDEGGFAGAFPSLNWFWDWALEDGGSPADTGNGNWVGDPTSQAFLNSTDTINEKKDVASWLAQMEPQSWWNAYHYGVNVAAAKAGDWVNAIPGYNYSTEGSGGLNPGGGGLINGLPPQGTADNESKGQEYELVGQITNNWDVSLNASKQFATETSLGSNIVDFVTAQHNKMLSPAGQLRLYWGGDNSILTYYNSEVWAPFEFLEGSSGRMVPEMSPWRFNAVTNYRFEQGPLRGIHVGLGERWQQGEILGYGILPDGSNLNINQPYWGQAIYATDAWVGWSHKFAKEKIGYSIQLNVHNVGQQPTLYPVSVEPDGTPANYRIDEGQTWELTNTLTF